jgi:hypothetical protein
MDSRDELEAVAKRDAERISRRREDAEELRVGKEEEEKEKAAELNRRSADECAGCEQSPRGSRGQESKI